MSTDIVVGIDGSPSAQAALTWAASHARASGARLRAIHVLGWQEAHDLYTTPVVSTHVYSDADGLDPAWTAAGRRMFATANPEPTWTLQFASGHPGQVMVDQSREAALLVLGTREHHGIGRLVTGSVSHYSINHASCPVVAVPVASSAVEPAPVPDVADVGAGPAGAAPSSRPRTGGTRGPRPAPPISTHRYPVTGRTQ